MCPREMWFSVVGRAEPAVSLLGAPVAGGRCLPRELLQPVGNARLGELTLTPRGAGCSAAACRGFSGLGE